MGVLFLAALCHAPPLSPWRCQARPQRGHGLSSLEGSLGWQWARQFMLRVSTLGCGAAAHRPGSGALSPLNFQRDFYLPLNPGVCQDALSFSNLHFNYKAGAP